MLRRIAWTRDSELELLDFVARPATAETWKLFWTQAQDWDFTYSVDGHEEELLPGIDDVVATREHASPCLYIQVATARLDCLFHDEEELRLVASSKELSDLASADAVGPSSNTSPTSSG